MKKYVKNTIMNESIKQFGEQQHDFFLFFFFVVEDVDADVVADDIVVMRLGIPRSCSTHQQIKIKGLYAMNITKSSFVNFRYISVLGWLFASMKRWDMHHRVVVDVDVDEVHGVGMKF